MKRIIASIAISTVILGGSIYAADPGSKEDPLVTKSYVDSKIEGLREDKTSTTELEKKLNEQQQLIDLLFNEISNIQGGEKSTYELVTIGEGQTLVGEQGTEIILRAGKARVVGSANGGVQDVTDGVDLKHGQDAPKYHLTIIPRTEGRGLFAETEIIVMVRGGYTIQ